MDKQRSLEAMEVVSDLVEKLADISLEKLAELKPERRLDRDELRDWWSKEIGNLLADLIVRN